MQRKSERSKVCGGLPLVQRRGNRMRRVGGLRSSERLPADNRELSPPTVSQEALPTSGRSLEAQEKSLGT